MTPEGKLYTRYTRINAVSTALTRCRVAFYSHTRLSFFFFSSYLPTLLMIPMTAMFPPCLLSRMMYCITTTSSIPDSKPDRNDSYTIRNLAGYVAHSYPLFTVDPDPLVSQG